MPGVALGLDKIKFCALGRHDKVNNDVAIRENNLIFEPEVALIPERASPEV